MRIVNDQGGYVLPETGGIGTALFTALGGLMTATAGAVLALRRKRKTA
jgi:LPXTG-motif cell wall-anchored protein